MHPVVPKEEGLQPGRSDKGKPLTRPRRSERNTRDTGDPATWSTNSSKQWTGSCRCHTPLRHFPYTRPWAGCYLWSLHTPLHWNIPTQPNKQDSGWQQPSNWVCTRIQHGHSNQMRGPEKWQKLLHTYNNVVCPPNVAITLDFWQLPVIYYNNVVCAAKRCNRTWILTCVCHLLQ